jgi:hypothetical protein
VYRSARTSSGNRAEKYADGKDAHSSSKADEGEIEEEDVEDEEEEDAEEDAESDDDDDEDEEVRETGKLRCCTARNETRTGESATDDTEDAAEDEHKAAANACTRRKSMR